MTKVFAFSLVSLTMLWFSTNSFNETSLIHEGKISENFNWNQLTLQDSGTTFPGVFIKEDDNVSKPLGIQDLSVNIQIIGDIAVTTLEMTFYNDLDRILEGELYFPLSKGQTVSRFAMDVNGQLREGVIVEKQKGRVAFESTTRQQIDPGLLEWTKGNNFKARVYPIPAKGTKKILIAYSQELKEEQGHLIYTLPMNFEDKLESLNINVALDAQEYEPIIRSNDYNFNFQKTDDSYLASSNQTNVKADKTIQLALPQNINQENVLIFNKDGETYFYVKVRPEILSKKRELPQSISLIWDVSNSAKNRNINKELEVLRRFLVEAKQIKVELITFSNAIHEIENLDIVGGSSEELIHKLKSLKFDGATQMGCLKSHNFKGEELLLFSDGLSNFGEQLFSFDSKPIYTINSSQSADHSNLEFIARSSGGQYINLNQTDLDQAAKIFTKQNSQFLGVNGTGISETYPSINTIVGENFTVCGKLNSEKTVLNLEYGYGNETTKIQKIQISKDVAQNALVPQIWAQKKVAELDLQYELNKAEITMMGKEFGLVTRNTSLIVLDRVEDYVQHEIVPPAELQKEYNKLITENKQSLQEQEKNHIDGVKEKFSERLAWWEKVYEVKSIKLKAPKVNINLGAQHERSRAAYYSADEVITQYAEDPDVGGEAEIFTNDNMNELTERSLESETEEPELSRGRILRGASLNDQRSNDSGGGIDELNGVVIQEFTRGREGNMSFSGTINDAQGQDAERDEITLPIEPDTRSREQGTYSRDDHDGSEDRAKNESKIKKVDLVLGTINRKKDLKSTLAVWTPNASYLKELKKQETSSAYIKYLDLKKSHENQPSFYLDVADHFISIGKKELALRILSNIAELEMENHEMLRVLGHRLQQMEQIDLAIFTFEEVLKIRAEEPQSYRDLALCYSIANRDQEAIDKLYHIVTNTWDSRFPDIQGLVLNELNNIIATSNIQLNLAGIDKELINNMPADIRVIVNWDTDNCDMDLWVTDSRKEKCFYSHKRTETGGRMSEDFTGGYGPEEFLIKKAYEGTYKVEINYYGSSSQKITGPTTVQVQLITNYGRADQKIQEVTRRLEEKAGVIHIGNVSL